MMIENVTSVLLALLPAVMIFKVPGTDFGFATLFVACLAFLGIIYMINGKMIRFKSMILLFVLYITIRNIGNGLMPIFYIMVLFVILASENSMFDFTILTSTIQVVALLASAVLIVQLIFHYLLNINFSPIVKSMVLSEYRGQTYGYTLSGTGEFRPSAFFLEPAHYCQYTIIALLITLLRNTKCTKRNIYLIFYTIGMLGSGSGIGILLCIGVYSYYVLKKIKGKKGPEKVIFFVLTVILVIIVILIGAKVSTVKYSLSRIFTSDSTGYNAVKGRSVHWSETVDTLTGIYKAFGIGPIVNHINGFLTGANEIIYYYGYFGVFLLIISLVSQVIKAIKQPFYDIEMLVLFSVCYFALFLAADVVGFISLTFWFSILVCNRKTNFYS